MQDAQVGELKIDITLCSLMPAEGHLIEVYFDRFEGYGCICQTSMSGLHAVFGMFRQHT